MAKNLHTDDFFKSAYQQFEDTPSADVWEKINTRLDKKDTDLRRRKFVMWRRSAFLLLLIPAGFILFDPIILKTNHHHSKDNLAIKKSFKPDSSGKNNEINIDRISSVNKKMVTQKTAQTKSTDGDNVSLLKQNDIVGLNAIPTSGTKMTDDKKTSDERKYLANQQFVTDIAAINHDKNTNYFLEKNETIQIKKSDFAKMFTELLNIKKPVLSQTIREPALKNNHTKIKMRGNNNSFKPYWLMIAFASYDRVNYKLDSDLPGNITSIKHREVPEPSFSGGILAIRQLKKNWGLQTGVGYSYTAIGISPQKLYALQDAGGDIAFKYITSSGYAYIKPGLGTQPAIGDSLNTTEGKHTLQAISIPVVIKYSVAKNKITVTPGVGIEANFVTSAKVETEIEHPNNPEIVFINKLDGAKPFYLSAVADAELRYHLNKKLSLNLRPAFRYAITPITKNNVVETFPYSFGLGVGITHKF